MRRPHYAWAICAGGVLTAFVIFGMAINIFSIYQPYIIEYNGFTNAQGSFITTIRSLFMLLSVCTANWVCDRLGIRKMMALAFALIVASCVCFAFANSYFGYCFGAFLSGMSYGYGGMIPISMIIGRWFKDRRGFALGLATSGSGIPTVLAPGIITSLIENYGLKTAFLAQAAFVLAIVTVAVLLLRDSPAEMGLTPYSLSETVEQAAAAAPAYTRDVSKMITFLLCLTAFLIGGPGGPGFSHITVLYSTCGYDGAAVAGFVSILGLTISLGKICSGQIYDVFGGFKGNFYMFGILLTALVLCCFAPVGGMILPYITVMFFGFGIPLSNVPFALWARDIYGDGGSERAMRAFSISYSLGMLFFGPLPGILADRFGSYVHSYAVFAIVLAASLFMVQYAYIDKAREEKRAKI